MQLNEVSLYGMEGTGEEVTANDAVEGVHLRRKENDHALKPSNHNMLDPSTMFISLGSGWAESSPQGFTDALHSRSLNRCVSSLAGSEPMCASPHSINDAGVMVEELTLNNYKNPNLSVHDSSNNREGTVVRQGKWQILYQLAGGLGSESSHGHTVSKDKEPVMSSGEEDFGSMFLPEFWSQKHLPYKQSNQEGNEISKQNGNDNAVLNDGLLPGGIRTKVLSASGFSQYFVKNTLKGKGVVFNCPETRDGVAAMGQFNEKAAYVTRVASDPSHHSSAKTRDPPPRIAAGAGLDSFHDETSLREWLKPGSCKINKVESLYIFRQILELVDHLHSQGIALQDIRPSCFKLLSPNRIKYVGSLVQKEPLESVKDQDIPYPEHPSCRKRSLDQDLHAYNGLNIKHQRLDENMAFAQQHHRLPIRSGSKHEAVNGLDVNNICMQESGYDFIRWHNPNTDQKTLNMPGSPSVSITTRQQLLSVNVQLEEKWYTSPEEQSNRGCTFSSNIYSLGVLLFELFSYFESREVHAKAMLDLRHRILPPIFLSEYPKEAGFCLWLLHPEPSSRPTTREILQSDMICESQDLSSGSEVSLTTDEDYAESELLLHFLLSLKEEKQKQTSKLFEDIGCLEADIEEVEKRNLLRTTDIPFQMHKSFSSSREFGFLLKEGSETHSRVPPVSNRNEARLMKNIDQLESAYFAMRSQIQSPEADASARSDKDLLKNRDRWFSEQNGNDELNQVPTDRVGTFFDGLCKYARYSKFEVRGTLRNGDLLNSANVICSLSFDRDEDYFAAAGVAKKIKIFEFSALLSDSVDIHYPVIEMSNKSKLSCVSWNNYIKNYLASTDYDGVVQLWDASTGQGFSQYTEHQRRAWSVDFSQLDPTKLASGGDDCSVKLWSINEKNSISTIRNVANICCVQFSAHSTHLLAFGSADYKTYCYDLRNTRIPWCTLAGHGKAVSYVKFLDSETLVSASTDNTLKLWDLNKTSFSGLSTNACSLTLGGHTNEKNFVGLSVSDGYIACGSETNEVYAYYKSFPMPITAHKFGSIDPISGQETGDDNGQFVSSVCWRGKSNMIVAANSSGSIKLLQMV
ncbi:PREDICTED: protein SPA1-RELATED 2-like isoform X1 [Nelumbo nucifera]|uniref:Protein SPA1-RELATED 2-like isoform X1 n=2 Tax=Nelumbo nucifera TaxID=4432 RepID=A0A1U8AU53_NELNU|nr:PREDICTED: protein SPA1-RELATED 2-like isoform X1 [Nelumbo nucifera]XP_019054417.1 PREDICTED: protein SPA1-RELATED 2-like isoform X1 [Nelumbo nucifera]DAD36335.1 TPA_asm: hypothetical protein HUJ06_006976 [Nelumbo nucifera]